MSELALKVENLGKKYIISHQKRESYTALRDVMAHQARSLGKRLLNPFKPDRTRFSKEEFWALKDVSFEVNQGDVVGIIGRNGAGKSTLLKILSRITPPTTGRITLGGRVASLLEVGTGFHPELTGRENIFLNGAILGMSRAEITRKFDEIVDFAEVEKFLDTPVKRYSSGMYVRLAFAVAAHMEPEILVVDEVLAVGDAAFQKKCLGKMGDVATKEGRTVLFVSHNISSLLALCNIGLHIKEGKLFNKGPINLIASDYLTDSSVFTSNYEKEISNPPKKLNLTKVSILKDNIPSTHFYNSENVVVSIAYTVTEIIKGAQIAFEVLTEMNECLFSTTNQDWNGTKETVKPGNYSVECVIPLNYFRQGNYSIKISSSIPGVEILDNVEELLAFEVQDDTSPILKLGQSRRGIILPVLEWRNSIEEPLNKSTPENLQKIL